MPSDNKLQNANDVGLLSGQRSFAGFVGQTDKVDSFKFSLSVRSSCSLSLSRLKTNANLKLIDANGTVIAASSQKGNKAENISSTLEAGTFYVQVFCKKGNTNYRLGAIAQAIPNPVPAPAPTPSPSVVDPLIYPSPEPGQSLRSAYDTGILTGVKGLQDFVGTYDPRDLYRFTLTQPSPVSAKVTGVTSDIGLTLIYDANSNGLIDSGEELGYDYLTASNKPYASVSRNLGAGNYFIRVLNDKDGFNTNYTLTIAPSDTPSSLPSPNNQPAYPNFVAVLPSSDPGSSLSTAYNTDILSGNRVYQDSVGITDGDDYYKFVVTQSSTFSARVAGVTSDVLLSLIYDANNNGLVDSGEELGYDYLTARYKSYASISRNLGAGTYFVKVKNDKVGYNTNYTLNLSA
jgi:hypothetical protein